MMMTTTTTTMMKENPMIKMKTKTMALFASLVLMTIPIDCLDLEQCRSSLGMQSLDIRDSALTASSSLDPHNTGPECARIRTEMKGGAWCPRGPISDESYEYLQIDLGELKVITLVETQGRFGRGQGQEYVEQYLLEYQRLDGGRWFKFKNRKGQQLFQGNTNTHVAELREVDPAVVARRLRFVPVSIQTRKVCLRVEIYGCKWEDGLLSYDLPQGVKRGSDVDLTDSTYDGHLEKGLAFGGLGQLTDGVEGHSNFRSDQSGLGVKGYEWVGWKIGEGLTLLGEMGSTLAKRDVSSFQANHSISARYRPKRSHQLDPIFYDYTSYTDRTSVDVDRRHRDSSRQADYLEMVFRFDGFRNFSSMRLHVNNQFTKDTRHFSTARVTFDPPSSEYLEFSYSRDSNSELARWISVPLENRVAMKLRVVLAFDSRWLLLSEVQFFSVPVTNPKVADGDAMVNNSPLPPPPLHNHHHHHHRHHHHHEQYPQFPLKPEMIGEEDDDDDGGRNITKPSISLQNENIVLTNLHLDDDVIQADDDDKLRNGEEFVGILVGALSVAILFLAAIFALMVVRKKRYGCLSHEECLTTNDSTKSSILVSIPRYLLKSNPNQSTSPPNYPSPGIAKVVAGSDIEIKSSPTFNSNLYNKLCTDDHTESKSDRMKFTSTPVTMSRNADSMAVNGSLEQTIIGSYVGDSLDQRTFAVESLNKDDRLSLSVKKDCLVFNPYETVKAIPSLYSNGTLKKKIAQHNREISPPNMQQQQHHQQQQQQQQHSRQHKKQQQGLPTFQGDELRIIKKLGSSRFFDTFLCETCVIQSKYGVRSNWTCQPVVMEMARDGRDNMATLPEKVVLKALKACTNAGRSYFEDVVKTMNVLRCRDDKSSSSGSSNGGNNVLQLLGFYYNDLWKSALIFEHIRFGNLDRVLRRYSTSSSSTLLSPNLAPSTTAGVFHYQSYHHHHHQFVDHDDIFDYQTIGTFTPTRRKQGTHIFSYGSLMYLGSQIASAMSYLEKLQIVHGSLSCRACLVGPNLVIKLADFVAKKWPQEEEMGVATKYPFKDCDVNKILKKLESANGSCPLRWMAWEVVLANKHAVKSDVWSFAVTLWELLTLSQDLPYSSLKDNQVVELFSTFSKNTSDAKKNDTAWHNVHLPKPSLCSSETYDLMSVCWSLDPSRRPSFEDIRLFLHQKVSGFRPLSEDVNILMDLLI